MGSIVGRSNFLFDREVDVGCPRPETGQDPHYPALSRTGDNQLNIGQFDYGRMMQFSPGQNWRGI